MTNKAEWKVYTGSDEQIAEMKNAGSFIIKANGVESHVMHNIDENGLLVKCDEYLICNKHRYAKQIHRWSVTGQPVHIKVENGTGNHLLDVSIGFYYFDLEHSVFITTTPDWNIPNAEYSFTPYEDTSYADSQLEPTLSNGVVPSHK